MSEIRVEFHAHGPLSDRRADRIAREFTDDLRTDLALGHGVILVGEMQRAFKHPRPHYWTTIDVVHRSANTDVITDHGSVKYNYWLAGRGSRNFPVTRFGGYRHWENADRRTKARFWPLAQQKMHRALARMEG